ncbi:hypothetical protein N8I71_01500 [Roseibacterium sp. SDUM158016]|nr:hypothetical protein [Roseibacterium sp. SDUM158016]MCU4651487.1 hypothetical protein [Roseibacterium sp. SDUM158016]
MRHIRHTIIVTSILLGMSGAIALASPYSQPGTHRAHVQTQH